MTWAHEKVTGSWLSRLPWLKGITVPGTWEWPRRGYRKIAGVWTVIGRTRVTNGPFSDHSFAIFPSDAEGGFRFRSDGQVQKVSNSSLFDYLDKPESSIGNYYEIFVTEAAGSPDPAAGLTVGSGDLDAWKTLSSPYEYSQEETGLGTTSVWLDVTIREIAHTNNSITSKYTLEAIVEP